MKRALTSILAALPLLLGSALLSASVRAQEEVGNTFVYTNNNANPNTVTGFSVGPSGTLTMLPGTPVLTGGGGFGTFFASNTATATMRKNFLYVSNSGTNDISAFKIDTSTGALMAVSGSPFATGGSGGVPGVPSGVSLAVTPNGRFLYAGNEGSGNISEFSIGSNGALTAVSGSPFNLGGAPDGIKVTPNGKFLGVALPFLNSVAMLKIGSDGALTPAPGSPFPQGGAGAASYVDMSCNSEQLFASLFNTTINNTQVAVSTIGHNGALIPITGSPFTFSGGDSSVGVLTPDNQWLFVSNQSTSTITSLDVESNGSLTQVNGSPFTDSTAIDPNGMATNREGTLLYAANGSNSVTGFSIDSNGALSSVPLSPFITGGAGFLRSLTVFPANQVEGEGDENGDDGHKGHFEFEGESKCGAHGEMEFEEGDPGGQKMEGSVDSMTVIGNTAMMSGSGTLLDGTPVQYTAVVLGNLPLIGANQFAISWITLTGSVFNLTGSVFKTSGALTNGYIAVHP